MRTRDLRLAGALLLLGWLASPYWPTTVDDVYISVGFAQQWSDTGALTWVDGARVEGYSNFLWVALLALAAHIGTDPGLGAQFMALGAASGVLTILHARLPYGWPGTLALLATAGLAPLSYWAVVGMETTLYALLLVLGWSKLADAIDQDNARAWTAGVGWLALASLTRLEGIGHLGLALGLRTLLPHRVTRSDGATAAVVGGWLAYHGVRVAWFGAVLPTPVLVKISGQDWGSVGLVQAAGSLALGTGALALCSGMAWPGQRRAALAALPLLVQGAVLVRANGDWMGHGRLVLPGLLAAAAVLAGTLTARACRPRWAAGLGLAGAGWLWMPGGDLPLSALRKLPNPTHYTLGLDTPVAEDLAWIANHLPPHSEFLAIDAGVLSTVPNIRLVDLRGLVHRDLALAASEQRSQSVIEQWRQQGSAPEWTRVAIWTDSTVPPVPSWLIPERAEKTEYRYGGGTIRWFGPPLSELPSPTLVRDRWFALLRRYPNQPFIAWKAAIALRANGDDITAKAIFERAAQRWPRHRFLDSYALATLWAMSTSPLDYQGEGLHSIDKDYVMRSAPLEAGSVYRIVVHAGDVAAVQSIPREACAISWEADNAFVVGPGCSAALHVQGRDGLILQTTIGGPEAD